jgi:hypothetical protein
LYWIGFCTFASAGVGPWSSYIHLPSRWDYRYDEQYPACFLRQDLANFAWAGLKLQFSYLHLLRSWNYRYVPPCLASSLSSLKIKDSNLFILHP